VHTQQNNEDLLMKATKELLGEGKSVKKEENHPAAIQNGGTILIVEDYAPNEMVARLMLEGMGYKVVAVETGEEAIKIVTSAAETFLAILMDVQMQGMDGLETTRRIHDLEAVSGVRQTIIGVTAHALAGDRERCLSAGMDDYISKPIHPDILEAKLGQLVTAAT